MMMRMTNYQPSLKRDLNLSSFTLTSNLRTPVTLVSTSTYFVNLVLKIINQTIQQGGAYKNPHLSLPGPRTLFNLSNFTTVSTSGPAAAGINFFQPGSWGTHRWYRSRGPLKGWENEPIPSNSRWVLSPPLPLLCEESSTNLCWSCNPQKPEMN